MPEVPKCHQVSSNMNFSEVPVILFETQWFIVTPIRHEISLCDSPQRCSASSSLEVNGLWQHRERWRPSGSLKIETTEVKPFRKWESRSGKVFQGSGQRRFASRIRMTTVTMQLMSSPRHGSDKRMTVTCCCCCQLKDVSTPSQKVHLVFSLISEFIFFSIHPGWSHKLAYHRAVNTLLWCLAKFG